VYIQLLFEKNWHLPTCDSTRRQNREEEEEQQQQIQTWR
jgi:hypothetical protein